MRKTKTRRVPEDVDLDELNRWLALKRGAKKRIAKRLDLTQNQVSNVLGGWSLNVDVLKEAMEEAMVIKKEVLDPQARLKAMK